MRSTRATRPESLEGDDFGLIWPGKSDAEREAEVPATKTLVARPERSIDFRTTKNALVVGDNLEALRLLRATHGGLAKMIYVDPPYNTRQRLTFVDRFPSDTKPGRARAHAGWLSMMWPRLVLARELLRDDGAIFVSIDDREAHRLRAILDEIFGEDAFVAQLVWPSKKGGGNDVATLVADHEYVLVYARDPERVRFGTWRSPSAPLDLRDERGPYRRGRELNKWGAGSSRADRPTMFFPIPGPSGEDVYPIRNDGSEGRWRRGREAMLQLVRRGDALFEPRGDGTYVVYEKIRGETSDARPFRTLLEGVGGAAEGRARLKELFGGDAPFEFAKPPSLVRRLVAIGAPDPDSLVVDFFAGSATTGDAIFAANADEGTRRRFLLVQSDEAISRGRFATVADLAIERLKRAGEDAKRRAKTPLDAGFRVLEMASGR